MLEVQAHSGSAYDNERLLVMIPTRFAKSILNQDILDRVISEMFMGVPSQP